MRKVSEITVKAFLNNKYASVGNTIANSVNLQLHGNIIAWKEKGCIFIKDCGWQTVTTKERLNILLSILNVPTLRQKKGQWFFTNGNKWNGIAKLVMLNDYTVSGLITEGIQ